MDDEFFTRPILRVQSVALSIEYYRDRLGFKESWRHGSPEPIVAAVERSGIEVILDSASVLPKPPASSVLSLSLHQPTRLGALYRELVERGARVIVAPFAVIWQPDTYQFEVEDLDGNRLVFWGDPPV